MYVPFDWYNKTSGVTSIPCFIVDFQEPYVMLKYTPNTPLFDERFYDYGYNKVQLFEHLRAAGYKFHIMNNVFSVDILHHPYKSINCVY